MVSSNALKGKNGLNGKKSRNEKNILNGKMEAEVSIIVPAHNEERNILRVLRVIGEYVCWRGRLRPTEVIIIDDGSTDRTWQIISGFAAKNGFSAVRFPENRGKGAAIAEGVRLSHGNVLVFIDSDLIGLRKEHIDRLVEPVTENFCVEAIGVQDVFSPKIWRGMTNMASYLMPTISGQRAIRRQFVPITPELVKRYNSAGYLIESLINMTVDRLLERALRVGEGRASRQGSGEHRGNGGKGVLVFVLDGLSQVVKEKKRGIIRGAIERNKMWTELFSAKKRMRGFQLPKSAEDAAIHYIRKHPFAARRYGRKLTRLREDFALMRYHQIERGMQKEGMAGLMRFMEERHIWSLPNGLRRKKAIPLQRFNYPLRSKRIMVIAPHCDDEAVGTGGLIAKAASAGAVVRVVIMTDSNKRKKGSIRKTETRKAMRGLGLEDEDIVFLGLPEKRFMSRAVKKGLGSVLAKSIRGFGPDIIVGPSPFDKHPHHSFIGKTLAQLRLPAKVRRLYYVIWFSFASYLALRGSQTEKELMPHRELLKRGVRWLYLGLSREEEAAKENAVRMYRSQLRLSNPFLKQFLLSFVRRNELFMEFEAERKDKP